jgi:hypothetical protein
MDEKLLPLGRVPSMRNLGTAHDDPVGRNGAAMTGRTYARYALIAVLSTYATLFGAVMCSVAIGSTRPTVPRQDSFTGRITSATGKFRGDRGHVTILLKTDDPGAHSPRAKRRLTLVLEGRRCSGARRCIRVTGRLEGTLIAHRSIPDVGVPFTIAAHGIIRALGHVSAAGSVRGTGFILSAHEPLRVALSAPGGRVLINAKSGKVPGFTSP